MEKVSGVRFDKDRIKKMRPHNAKHNPETLAIVAGKNKDVDEKPQANNVATSSSEDNAADAFVDKTLIHKYSAKKRRYRSSAR
ncbi:MAG: hypothetical protein LBF84_04150 [Holosporales bacterium]|nr:hypothetical protein [Holosporales bacterium]